MNAIKNSSSEKRDPFNTKRNQPMSRGGLFAADGVACNNKSIRIDVDSVDSDDEYQTAARHKESDNGEIM